MAAAIETTNAASNMADTTAIPDSRLGETHPDEIHRGEMHRDDKLRLIMQKLG